MLAMSCQYGVVVVAFRWPCDAIRLADALDRLTAERDELRLRLEKYDADTKKLVAAMTGVDDER
jgi:hypothetical protein